MEINCVVENIKDELASRDKCAAELKVLTDNQKAFETELEQVEKSIVENQLKADDALKRGGQLTRLDNTMRDLQSRREMLRGRLERLEHALIPDAERALENAQQKIFPVTVRAFDEPKAHVEGFMSEKFNQAMNAFNEFNEACNKVLDELKITLRPGSTILLPQPVCPDLFLLFKNGLLRSMPETSPPVQTVPEPEQVRPEAPTPTEPPTPSLPIAEPVGEPQPEEESAEPQPAGPGAFGA